MESIVEVVCIIRPAPNSNYLDIVDKTKLITRDNLIRWLPFIKELPAEEINSLLDAFHLSEFPSNTILFYEEDAGDRLYLVVEGEVEIIKFLGKEAERRLGTLTAGAIFGEMSLLIPDRSRYASARAVTQVVLLEMLHNNFESLMLHHPHLGIHILQEMTVRWSATEQGIISELREKNQQLEKAYEELKLAQARLIERERLEHELKLAQKIQQGILPAEIPDLAGWQISVHWQPAHAVGGDFYDFVPFPNDKIGVLIGDATGKGIPAALVMATTCSILRAIAAGLDQERELPPGDILSRANNLLCQQMPPGMFITCLLAMLDVETGEMEFANAGHCLPIQLMAEGIYELRATGMPLGLLPGMDYDNKHTTLHFGDRLVLFSDGLIEAHNPSNQILGVPQVQKILVECSNETEIIKHLQASLADFTGPGWEQEDDMTLVALHRIR